MHEWLTSPSFSLSSQMAVNHYDLTFSVPSPGNSTTFVEFSQNGRFLAAGDRDLCSLYILDGLAGFHPTMSTTLPAEPTTLVWETSMTFYIGLSDGRFVHYRIDLEGNELIKGTVNSFFYGPFPTTAMALDAESKTLVLSVGPDVFAFRRARINSKFHSSMNQASGLTCLEADSASSRISQAGSISRKTPGAQRHRFQDLFVLLPITRSSSHFVGRTSREACDHGPKLRTHCFAIRSIVLEFDGDSHLHSSFQTVKM